MVQDYREILKRLDFNTGLPPIKAEDLIGDGLEDQAGRLASPTLINPIGAADSQAQMEALQARGVGGPINTRQGSGALSVEKGESLSGAPNAAPPNEPYHIRRTRSFLQVAANRTTSTTSCTMISNVRTRELCSGTCEAVPAWRHS